jgi:putative ABC transport system permease protein
MGLFGLSGLVAAGRIKEIGIRKVFGASTGRLFLLLNKRSFTTVIISFLIALPFSYYLASEWLQNFAYRIKLDWSLFALSGFISMVMAIIAVSYHIIKAARANPVKSLRPE